MFRNCDNNFIQLNLAGSVHTETKKEEIYLDMEFELGNEKDNIEEKLRELNLRLNYVKNMNSSLHSKTLINLFHL